MAASRELQRRGPGAGRAGRTGWQDIEAAPLAEACPPTTRTWSRQPRGPISEAQPEPGVGSKERLVGHGSSEPGRPARRPFSPSLSGTETCGDMVGPRSGGERASISEGLSGAPRATAGRIASTQPERRSSSAARERAEVMRAISESRASSEPWPWEVDPHHIASRFLLEKCTLQESWLVLSELLFGGELPICEATRYIASTVGNVADELLPLPVPPDPLAAHRIGVALATGISLIDLRQQFKRDWACTCKHRWTTLVITALSLMNGGLSCVRAVHAPAPWEQRTPALETSTRLRALDVEVFLLEGTTEFPVLGWAALQRSLKTSDSGDIVLKGQALEWERMEPGQPPLGLAGSMELWLWQHLACVAIWLIPCCRSCPRSSGRARSLRIASALLKATGSACSMGCMGVAWLSFYQTVR